MLMKMAPPIRELMGRLDNRTATIGVCGLGYVGLPLAMAAANSGFGVIGFDIDDSKAQAVNEGKPYINGVTSDELRGLHASGRLRATASFSELSQCDVIVVCVPTPLSKHREPDLSFLESTTRTIASNLRRGQLIIIESTTYPGTTRDLAKPILEKTGLMCGEDFLLGYSPERRDPGNKDFDTSSTPKIAAGEGEAASDLIHRFYSAFVKDVKLVSTTQTAEAVKLTENIFRAVNIALVNELKILFAKMDIDIWEVIEAAKTKPFGYMPFYPGPGLGGHCIPIDPFYLTWKAREYDLSTRFIELAGEINASMPAYVVERLALALDQRLSLPLSNARILIVGVSYKRNVADMRESPALTLIELIEDRRAKVDFHDPHVTVLPPSRNYPTLTGRRSVALDAASIGSYSAVLIATDHDAVDYKLIAEHARLIVDTRNVLARNGFASSKVIKA
ncbi:MAG TPA: nucleotide sugar dehydrogenase [Aestuariivirgaceae bacterium]|jgi:UDP-N-acetyl-D-glucosamine dehydrogenase